MQERDNGYGFRLLFRGLFILLVLIGLGAFASTVIYSVLYPNMPLPQFINLNWVGELIGLLITIWIVFFVLRHLFGMPGYHPLWDEKAIARRRYARGRISKKEYLEIVKDLEKTK